MQTTSVKLQLLVFKQQQKKIPFNFSYALGLELSKSSHKCLSFLWEEKSGCKGSDTSLANGHFCGEQVPEIPSRLTEANSILHRCLFLTVQDEGLEQSS